MLAQTRPKSGLMTQNTQNLLMDRRMDTETDHITLYPIKKFDNKHENNRLVHHLISAKLCYALPKCTSVQNYKICKP